MLTDLYPVTFLLDEDMLAEVTSGVIGGRIQARERIAANEAELMEVLKQILNSNKARRVVGAILSQLGVTPP